MTTVIGSVPYLNAKPLIRWFDTEEGKHSGYSVIEATPAMLASMLARGEIAVAMVSSFTAFLHPEYKIAPSVSISGQNEIKSVRAFSRLPFRKVETVAMDSSSLTSVALLRILLAELYDSHPAAVNHAPDLHAMLDRADAALLIGDNGMLADGKGLRVLDLGEGWRRLTGKPFTYAAWIGPPKSVTREMCKTLIVAKEYGMTRLEEIAREEAIRLSCPVSVCRDYLTNVMDYDLEDEHHEALALFHDKCRMHGLLSDLPAKSVPEIAAP